LIESSNLILSNPEAPPVGSISVLLTISDQVTSLLLSKFGPTLTAIVPKPSYPSGTGTSPFAVIVPL
jgi:hypothetical protein